MKVELITHPKDVPLLPCDNPHNDNFDGRWYITLVPIHVLINDELLVVPTGFTTDLGTIPKIFRNIVDAKDQSTMAFIVHDFLGRRGTFEMTRKSSDKVLCSIARRSDQSKFQATLAYLGTRIGGFVMNYYKKHGAVYKEIPEHVKYNILNGTATQERKK